MGDSRYVLEPNVKEGKGGLRDLHLLFWIAKYLYRVSQPAELVAKGVLTREEARHFERADRFLSTVRCHIHYLTNRADDRVSFDLQREMGLSMADAIAALAARLQRAQRLLPFVAAELRTDATDPTAGLPRGCGVQGL